jgi:uncharacterized delta-60 repeat protein
MVHALIWLCALPSSAHVPAGLLDSFNPGADARVTSLAVQTDGKILVGGFFNSLSGYPRRGIARLNPDGTLDMRFIPATGGSVSSLAVQPDGKILTGGYTAPVGELGNHIGRLRTDGTLDEGFSCELDGTVRSLAVRSLFPGARGMTLES